VRRVFRNPCPARYELTPGIGGQAELVGPTDADWHALDALERVAAQAGTTMPATELAWVRTRPRSRVDADRRAHAGAAAHRPRPKNVPLLT